MLERESSVLTDDSGLDSLSESLVRRRSYMKATRRSDANMTAPSGLTPTPPPANKLQKSAVAEAEQASLSQKLEQPLPVTKITLF